jgi:putative DNA modification/repair radical SAM protein
LPKSINEKLAILADAAKYDASCASSGSKVKRSGDGIGSTEGMGICHSYTPDGRCISLLKILLTNYCIYNCKYCINRISSDISRARFTPEEVVYLTVEFYRRNYVEGLFLSSGIVRDSDYTMGQMVEVAKKLRIEHGFRGYIHLKTIPGADDALVTQAGMYADRLSVNIELPTEEDLKSLAPEKKRPVLEQNMASIEQRIAENKYERKTSKKKPPVFTPAGQSTQMIIGATPTPDREVLKTAGTLYDRYRLRRVYYSAYSPIQDSHASLPSKSPPLVREHRLYQADWLLRFYGFRYHELTDKRESLRLDMDPKTAWAADNREFFPVDVNQASREALLRVPGLGVRTVSKILKHRRQKAVRWADLRKMRCDTHRARPFVICADKHPGRLLEADNLEQYLLPAGEQLSLPI